MILSWGDIEYSELEGIHWCDREDLRTVDSPPPPPRDHLVNPNLPSWYLDRDSRVKQWIVLAIRQQHGSASGIVSRTGQEKKVVSTLVGGLNSNVESHA